MVPCIVNMPVENLRRNKMVVRNDQLNPDDRGFDATDAEKNRGVEDVEDRPASCDLRSQPNRVIFQRLGLALPSAELIAIVSEAMTSLLSSPERFEVRHERVQVFVV